MAGKCPKCEKIVSTARLAHMDISDGAMKIKAFSANCPFCQTTMGVIVDPRPIDRILDRLS